MLESTASRSLRSWVSVRSLSSSSSAMRLMLSATTANSSTCGTKSLCVKSPAARRSAPALIARIWPLMRRETQKPMRAAITATTRALMAMLPYRTPRASFMRVSGMAVRRTVVMRPSSRTGMATYIMFSPSVSLKWIVRAGRPSRAIWNSVRSAWFSIVAGSESESASTSPRAAPGRSAAMRVMRVPDASPRRRRRSSSCCGESASMAATSCSRMSAPRA